MRRNDNKNTYKIETARGLYAVVLDSLNCTAAGCPRYNATIIVLSVNGEENNRARDFYSPNFTFKGHYDNAENEARFIVEHYESILN